MKAISYLLILTLVVILLSSCGLSYGEPQIYVFADTDECVGFESLVGENGEVVRYDPSNDEHLGELGYSDFYAASLTASEWSFEIFAYQFKSEEHAKIYFERVTGKGSDASSNFSYVLGLNGYRLAVVDGCNAYIVKSPASSREDVDALLSRIFSKKLDFSDE